MRLSQPRRLIVATAALLVAVTLTAFTGKLGRSHTTSIQSPQTITAVQPNVVVVKLRQEPGATARDAVTGNASLDALLARHQISKLEPVLRPAWREKTASLRHSLDRVFYVHYDSEASPHEVATALQAHPAVEYAEPLRLHTIDATPNDPAFSDQAFFDVVKARQAWDVVKGEQGNVVIAIVDGGTDIDHEDLNANLWVNANEIPNNGIDDDNNGFIDDVNGWNFANDGNDPTGLPNTPGNADHGTHTAGIAAAVTNNGIGVSGVSWNAKLMPVNAASPTSDQAIQFGFAGILYAALSGADVISLSWGSLGSPSIYEQEVIDMVTDMGVAVVAAAGNNGTSRMHFPSAYRNVLAVVNTNNSDVKDVFSNYGTWADVTAPGVNIRSTFNGNRYGNITGTSMSSPLVAGVVALVKTQHPEWSGLQASEQVRVTADNIDGPNPSYAGLLGKGRLNAQRAVSETSPSVRITALDFKDQDGDGVIEPGEAVTVTVALTNYLATVSNLSVVLTSSDPNVAITNSSASVSSLGTLQSTSLSDQFRFTVASNAPSGHPLNFKLSLTAGNYSDFDFFTLTVLPLFGNLGVNNLVTSVTNIGRLGFADANNSANGVGVRFLGGPNLLFEGGIIAGTGPGRISNTVRGLIAGSSQLTDDDFAVAPGGDVRISTPGGLTDQESTSIFDDSKNSAPLNIRITQATFARSAAPNDDFILYRYTVENAGSSALQNFHFGIFFDWDIDGGNYATNRADYDAARKLGYAFDSGSGPDTYVGMALMTEGGVSYRAIYNDPNLDPNDPPFGLHDGFTDAEKWETISSGVVRTAAGPADISFVIGSGPFNIVPNGTVDIGFAMVAGVDLNSLQSNTDAARALWNSLFVTAVKEHAGSELPTEYSLAQNYPNPFNPETEIEFALPQTSEVTITVYDALGQRVRTLAHDRQAAGVHRISWDGRDELGQAVATGIYLYRLQAEKFVTTRKMLLVR